MEKDVKGDNMYLKIENLKKDFPTAHIDFSMSCEKGQLICLLGASGSGKSTILKMISGLETSDSPDAFICLDGKEIQNVAPSKRGVGMVFQNGALFSHLNVEDNVAYGLISSGMKKSDARKAAQDYLKNFNLEGFGKRPVETLSGGEKQRVALARTLITNPKLVLLDEPLSALDADLRKKLAAQIKEWHKTFGWTGIMVTHDEEEARTVADAIIRL